MVLRNKEIATAGVWYILLFGMLLAGSVSCSKEHEAPVAFHQTLLDMPTQLEAEFQARRRVILTWTMEDIANVSGYLVSLSDTTGLLRESLVADTTHTIEESSLTAEGFTDSTWFFIRVSAVDSSLFRGPAAHLDTVFVF
jgi:hypothetical protein